MPTTTRRRRTTVLRRDSYAAERSAPAQESPFRSYNPSRRYIAALTMVHVRLAEISDLQAALARATDLRVQRRLATRLLATKNNLASWEAYLDGSNEQEEAYYREKRAVIIPDASKLPNSLAKSA